MRPSTTPPSRRCPSMLLTSSERGWPATSSQPGFSVLGRLRRSRRGEGREPRDGHLVNFFPFFFSPLNKCHFLRQRRNREQFRYPFLWGRLMPQAPSLLPKTLIFPNLVNLQTPETPCSSQIPLKMILQGGCVTQPHLLDQIWRENP